MGKTYIDVVKYMVEARFEVSGLAEKPDIIGAIFGQTEGLLGGGLDLRELQKNGKIGRIEIDVSNSGNKTLGKLFLPSSLGRVETCILGATIESVDRVGPFETNFKINRIEDTRNEKRRKIVNRAKELLKTLITTEMPDSREISEQVEADVKSSVVTSYGTENLPAGPDIDTSEEVIFVEGRADVINLLKNDITNCIAVGGATGTIPKTIIDLSKSKETVLFLDGDRGGDMILRGLSNVCEVDFVVRAPDGKEVEELTRKDIIKSLRTKIPIEQALSRLNHGNGHGGNRPQFGRPQRFEQRRDFRGDQRQQHQGGAPMEQRSEQVLSPTEISRNMFSKNLEKKVVPPMTYEGMLEEVTSGSEGSIKDLEGNDVDFTPKQRPQREQQAQQPSVSIQGSSQVDPKFRAALDELHNTLRGRIYDTSGSSVAEVPIRELMPKMQDLGKADIVVFDGIITQRLIELANRIGVRAIYGSRASQITRPFEGMLLFTKEQGVVGS
ncbi:MAG: DNA primase [Candidatus Micrarchaeota archaeon]|nr:DNA primase [Candidatus Micrarchaeota archaeon]